MSIKEGLVFLFIFDPVAGGVCYFISAVAAANAKQENNTHNDAMSKTKINKIRKLAI